MLSFSLILFLRSYISRPWGQWGTGTKLPLKERSESLHSIIVLTVLSGFSTCVNSMLDARLGQGLIHQIRA
jgi:hypothetical protein